LPDQLIAPHGGHLTNLLVDNSRATELRRLARTWPSWDLTQRQLCDLELLLNGGFSPLRGFMRRADYESVCASMRLGDGTLWPIPITLDVPSAIASKLYGKSTLALRDPEGVMLAALHVDEIWQPDLAAEARDVFGTTDELHPAVAYLQRRTHAYFVAGALEGLQLPTHYDFEALRLTPAELRGEFGELGWRHVVAFQTRNPMHRAHQELTIRAAKDVGAKVLIHPSVGMTKPGDVDHYTRVRCYQAVLPTYPANTAKLSLLPLAMRMGGPREALWHAIIRKNYGCSHFIIGRDHAGPGNDASGKPFYGEYDAQELVCRYEKDLCIQMVRFRNMVYVEGHGKYMPDDEVPNGSRVLKLSGTDLRHRLAEGEQLPTWFTFSEVARELHVTSPPRDRQGFSVFFTGLSGAGKSTIANVLLVKLLELGGRAVTLLDGDIVRQNLSQELGFSKRHRDMNIRRIGFVASEITKHGGIAICAPIAPYDEARREVRSMIEAAGGFVLVFLSTPLATCEQRDRKGLYAKARGGTLKEFTGVSDPYEVPTAADLVIDTRDMSADAAARAIISYLERRGYVRGRVANGVDTHVSTRSSEQ
jgi:sulfate adenylyltransferase